MLEALGIRLQRKWREKDFDFTDKALFFMVILGLASFLFAGQLKVNQQEGVSMSRAIPPGSVIVWEYRIGYAGLQEGDIGCYTADYYERKYNRTEFIFCHHVNSTAGGMYAFHTDPQ